MTAVTGSFGTQAQSFATDPGAVGYKLTLTEVNTGAELVGTAPLTAASVTIDTVPAGTYKGHIAIVDGAGTEVVAGVDSTVNITVAQPFTFLNVPTSLTLATQ
jgi:hypothetical protein